MSSERLPSPLLFHPAWGHGGPDECLHSSSATCTAPLVWRHYQEPWRRRVSSFSADAVGSVWQRLLAVVTARSVAPPPTIAMLA